MRAATSRLRCHTWLFGVAVVILRSQIAAAADDFCSPSDQGFYDKLPATLIDAETELRAADNQLERARQGMVDAQATVDRATSGLEETNIADAATALRNATVALQEATLKDEDAVTKHHCVERLLMEARTWRYGYLLGAHGSMDAAGSERWGAQFEFVWHPYGLQLVRELDATVRWSNIHQNGTTQNWGEAIVRVGFPFGGFGNFSFGPGLALPIDHRDTGHLVALTGDVGLGLRLGQWLRWSEQTGLAGARFFMQPWFTANTQTTVLFGLELSFGLGHDRVGRLVDQKFGRDMTLPKDLKP